VHIIIKRTKNKHMTYSDYKEEVTAERNKIMTKHGVFWAFGQDSFRKQFDALNLPKGEKVASIGAGGYLPSKNFDQWLEELNKVKKFTGDRVQAIKYELNNHEYKISMDPEQCIETVFEIIDACTDGISLDLVKEVARYKG